MRPILLFAFNYALLATASEFNVDMRNNIIHLEQFLSPCPESRNKQQDIEYDVHVQNKPGYLLLDYDVNVRRDLPRDLLGDMHIERCSAKEAPDTCVKMTTFKLRKYCDFMGSEKDFWSSLVMCLKPDARCPINKHLYKGRNCTFDMSNFNWFPLGSFYWKVKLVLFTKKPARTYSCIIAYAEVKRKK